MRVVLVATRDPGGRQSGRKVVLGTTLRTLASLGHDVEVVVLSRRALAEGAVWPHRVRLRRVRPPGAARIAVNVATLAARRRLSLNECLYFSPRLARTVRRLAAELRADVVVADMIRTVPVAAATDKPLVVDLDDLLSDRYRRLGADGADRRTVLGYYGQDLPAVLARPLARVATAVVRWEAGLVAEREAAAALAADAVSLVSRAEARTLQERLGRPVAWLPMAVSVPPVAAPVATNPAGAVVFTGGLDYHPNLEAVRWFLADVVPALDAAGLGAVRLRVAGYCPDHARGQLASPRLDLAGYVEDLGVELSRHRAFLAPVRSGTGIKTKVLEAMAAGLPVVSTSEGVKGLEVVHGEHCYVADTPAEMARWLRHLADHPGAAAAMGAAGRALVTADFSPEVVARRWEEVLRRVSSPARGGGAGPG